MGQWPRAPSAAARRPHSQSAAAPKSGDKASEAATASVEIMGLESSGIIRNQNVNDIFRHRKITRDSSQGTVPRYLQQTLLC